MGSSTKTSKRTETILALIASGLTHKQVATQLNCSAKTIQRHSTKVKHAIRAVKDLNVRASAYTEKVMSIESRIDRIVELSKNADSDSVSLAAIGKLDDYDGFIPDKERLHYLGQQQSHEVQSRPMFLIGNGAQVHVHIDTTSSNEVTDNGAAIAKSNVINE